MVLSTTLQRWRHLRHCTDSSTYKQTPLSTEQWSSRAHSQNCEGPTPELVRHALALVWSQSRWTANGQKTQDWCSGDKVMTHAQLAPPSRFPWEGQRVETETEGNVWLAQLSVCSVSTLPDDTVPGRVVTTADTPCPYVVEIPSGGYIRRNHSALSTHAENTITCMVDPTNSTACSGTTGTRSQAGISIWPPDHLRTGEREMEMWCELIVVNYLAVHDF